jgi:predicted AAA+ superfamily ATPase
MERMIERNLLKWKEQVGRKPLLIRGGRQVGKSHVIEKFGKAHFDQCVIVNFEFHRECLNAFKTLDPVKIIASLSILRRQEIVPGKTLLFIDEIQECPDAILALRYFKEMMPILHVIAAGSLLEFTLNREDFRMPVGRVESLYMYPCSFKEFLMASNEHRALEYLSTVTVQEGIDPAIHEMLLAKLREYFIVGGMPEALDYFVNHHDYLRVQALQGTLRNAYRNDFGKYAAKGVKVDYLSKIYDIIPSIVGKHFKYTSIDSTIQARDLKPSVKALEDASLIHFIYHTAASGLPLSSTVNERRAKPLFIDIGLLNNASGLSMNEMLNDSLILLNQGALAEQFVGQEFCAYSRNYEKAQLFYWERDKPSIAEVDYVIHVGSKILPVEVKSGKTGRLKSLQQFVAEKSLDFGIRISEKPLSFERGVLSVPMYMIYELDRLANDVFQQLDRKRPRLFT